MAVSMRIPTIFTAVDRFSSVVSKMTATSANFGRTTEAAVARAGRKMNAVGTSMLTAGTTMAFGLGLAVNEAVKFEESMAKVATLGDRTPAQIKKVSAELLSLSQIIPKSIPELTEGFYEVGSAGIKAADQMAVFEASARLAVPGLGSTKEAVDIMTSAFNTYRMEGKDAAKVANQVFKAITFGKMKIPELSVGFGRYASIMESSGVSLEEYLATTATLTQSGLSAPAAQTQIGSAVGALIKPTEKSMRKVYEKLGVKSTRDIPAFIKQNGGLVKTLKLLSDTGKGMNIDMAKIFGRKEGLAAVLSLTGALGRNYENILSSIKSGTDTIGPGFNVMLETSASKLQLAKNNMTILAITIGTQLLPKVNELLSKIIGLAKAFSKWSTEHKGLATLLWTATTALIAFGVAAKVGAALFWAYGAVITTFNAVMTAYTFVSTLAALANVSFAAALWAVLWPIGLIAVAIGALIWIVADMIEYWDDWSSVLLFMLGPLGQVASLIMAIADNWNLLTESFSKGGILAGFRAIGRVIIDVLLRPIESMMNILARIPGLSFLKGAGAWVGGLRDANADNQAADTASYGGVQKLVSPRSQASMDNKSEITVRVAAEKGTTAEVDKPRNVFGGVKVTSTTGIPSFS